eukprot:1097416-Prymnesium_polylepis.1
MQAETSGACAEGDRSNGSSSQLPIRVAITDSKPNKVDVVSRACSQLGVALLDCQHGVGHVVTAVALAGDVKRPTLQLGVHALECDESSVRVVSGHSVVALAIRVRKADASRLLDEDDVCHRVPRERIRADSRTLPIAAHTHDERPQLREHAPQTAASGPT